MTGPPKPSLASVPGAVMTMGCALMGSGEGAKAVSLVAALLDRHPDDPALASAARTILSHDIPGWHARMLADTDRNAAFARAIGAAVQGGGRVLDIGAGSGLLSLIAARGGAERVIACEANPALAATARDIVALNGCADRVAIVAARSTDLDADALGGRVDIVVAEIFSDNLLSEGALASFEHAVTALARPGAQVIPAAAEVRIALAHHPLTPAALADVEGFDLTPFARHLSPTRAVSVDSDKLSLRGAAATLLGFDLTAAHQPRNGSAAVRLVADAEPANGVIRWIALQLDADARYENAPGTGRPSHWAGVFNPFGRDLPPGAAVTVHAAHDRDRMHLWFDFD